MSKPFNEINEKDVDEFSETEESQNTKRKLINLIHSYITSEAGGHVNKPPKMEELSPTQLDTYLSKFLLAVRKKRRRMQANYSSRFLNERYLKKYRYCDSVVTEHSSARTTETLKSKQDISRAMEKETNHSRQFL